jgi:hypothetical protein
LNDLVRTDPREWVRQAELAFDRAHAERSPSPPPTTTIDERRELLGMKPAPPPSDPGERARR